MSGKPGYLFVVPWPVSDAGGVNQVVLNLYRHVEAGGAYTPRICVSSWDHIRPTTRPEDGKEVTYMRVRAPVASGKPVRSSAAWSIHALPDIVRIARYVRANGVTCVNIQYPSLSALQFVLARGLVVHRLKIILSFHGLDLAGAARTSGLERWLWKVLLQRADAVVACSDAQARAVLAFEPAIRPRLVTIHNGVDIDHLKSGENPVASIDPRLSGRPFVLSVASYQPKKGLDTLIRAFALVRDGAESEAMLALVGSDLGFARELRDLAARLGIADRVVFCGEVPHPDLHAYYRAASAFCLPSRAEPFGIVLLEAGAYRCAVVATRVGGIPEILEDGVNACLVPPDDPVALAAPLRRMLRDREYREGLAAALYGRVKADFPWANAYRSYMALCAPDSARATR